MVINAWVEVTEGYSELAGLIPALASLPVIYKNEPLSSYFQQHVYSFSLPALSLPQVFSSFPVLPNAFLSFFQIRGLEVPPLLGQQVATRQLLW